MNAPTTERSTEGSTAVLETPPWTVTVWDDPVNTIPYVTSRFVARLGVDVHEAHRLTMKVHHEGRSAVFSGDQERCELLVAQFHSDGLQASAARA